MVRNARYLLLAGLAACVLGTGGSGQAQAQLWDDGPALRDGGEYNPDGGRTRFRADARFRDGRFRDARFRDPRLRAGRIDRWRTARHWRGAPTWHDPRFARTWHDPRFAHRAWYWGDPRFAHWGDPRFAPWGAPGLRVGPVREWW